MNASPNNPSTDRPAAGHSAPEDDSALTSGPRRSVLAYAPWALLLLIIVGLMATRAWAPNADHAVANIMTVGLLFLAWVVTLIGLYATPGMRTLFGIAACAPFLLIAAALAIFRFERLDSELVPQFRPRWQSATPDLPATTASVEEGQKKVFYAASPGDFPQFLGPQRNAQVPIRLGEDWQVDRPTIVWDQPIGEGWSGFATQGSAAITMEQREDQEWVSAYAMADGSLLWKYAIDARHYTVPGGAGPRSTPSIFDDRVYACSAVGLFVCLDLMSGQELWSHDLLQLANTDQASFEAQVSWGRSGSPLVVDDLVVIPLGGSDENSATLIAFDRISGDEVWRSGNGQISYSSPILATMDGVPQILFISQDKLASYRPEDGELLWQTPWPGKSNANPAVAQPVLVDEKRLLLGKGYSEGAMLIEVSLIDGQWNVETLWKNTSVLKTKFSTAVVRNGFAYGLSDGILECIDLRNGKRQWKRGRYKHGQLLLTSDHLLILSESGDLILVAVDPNEFRELAEMPVIEGVSWNTIALSNDQLLVRNSDEAACISMPVVGPNSSLPSAGSAVSQEDNASAPATE